jgi:GNAT superfamily N-acetyltransferase
MDIRYQREDDLGGEEFVDVLLRSGLAARRPVDDAACIAAMLAQASLIVTARDGGSRLVGVSRCLSDFAYCCYCSDLAVDAALQGGGIGRELIRQSRAAAGEQCHFILISAPDAAGYYPHIGLQRFEQCFGLLGGSAWPA